MRMSLSPIIGPNLVDNITFQERVIRPTLFHLMVNNLGNYLKKQPTKSELSQYVDDSGIWTAGSLYSQDNIILLQRSLDAIGTWENNCGFKLYAITPTNKYPRKSELYIQNKPIQFQKEFMWMIVNDTLN
ncbi:hypothetical protein ACJMK2_041836 [Sinanodonta woodiana]|uniref:Uncharacterized protein n=1 Tax=Sinanodonta woodiana TaxID=1069815 RepID=A0ABD3W6T5_SINWO